MSVLENLEPQKVFRFFEEICEIPHGSGNIEEISDYLVAFAKERKLFVQQDELKNVIIIKEASLGYEECRPLILQGHMDMVTVKKPESSVDMEKDPLKLMIDGDYIYAKDTSLGGDDGIALAYCLSLLDSIDIGHPKLEVIFTVDEETGMDGAKDIDLSILTGNTMLNLDSEEEGSLLSSCAGGAKVECVLPLIYEKKVGSIYQISTDGLLGGHSGVEIHKERGNANYLLARVLYDLKEKVEFYLLDLVGGLKDNAIPRQAHALILVEKEDQGLVEQTIKNCEMRISHELESKDAGFVIICKREESLNRNNIKSVNELKEVAVLSKDTTNQVITLILTQPNGIQSTSKSIEGLVETSLNLGVMKLGEDNLLLRYAVRSSVQSAKEHLIDKMKIINDLLGATTIVEGDYPPWEFKKESLLREKMLLIYKEMYGKEMIVQAIHAGLECGFFAEKIKNLDCVAIGPNMKDIHTTEEKLSISSTQRVWEYILRILQTK